MLDTQRQINELIREERQILIDAGKEPRIAIGGFSQGAPNSNLPTHIEILTPSRR